MVGQKSNLKNSALSIGYFPGLDMLRFLCAAGVIFHHAPQMMQERGLIAAFPPSQQFSGSFFVDVFFVISGFLIGAILMKETEAGTYNLKNFFMRRIIRIWPLYFLIVLLLVVIVPVVKHFPGDIIKTNAQYAFGFAVNFQLLFSKAVNTYAVLWSVCIEEHIYLLLPLLLFLFRNNFKWLSVFMIALGLVSWFYFGSLHEKGGASPYYNSLCYFYFFGTGTLLACFKNFFDADRIKIIFSVPAQLVVFALLFAYVYAYFPPSLYQMGPWLLISNLLSAYLVLVATRKECVFALKPNISRYFGNISYGLYLVHITSINIFINLFLKNAHPEGFQQNWMIPLGFTLFSMAIASLLYYLYERPILKLKKKYTSVSNK